MKAVKFKVYYAPDKHREYAYKNVRAHNADEAMKKFAMKWPNFRPIMAEK